MATLPLLAELTDLKTWPGVIVDAVDEPSATAVLQAASAYIRVESGDPARWGDPATDPVPDAIKTLAVQVAARVWRNPDVAAMVTAGPFSEQHAQGVEDALYLTKQDRRVLRAVLGRSGMFTVSTTRDDPDYAQSIYDPFSGVTYPGAPYPPSTALWGGGSP